MRNKPHTRYQWSALVCQMLTIAEQTSTDTDTKELLHHALVILSYPSEYRNSKAFFERLDRLMDKMNGVPYESIGAKHLREAGIT